MSCRRIYNDNDDNPALMTQYFNPNYVRRHFTISISINITNTHHLKSANGFQSLSLTHQHLYFQHCLLPTVNLILKI